MNIREIQPKDNNAIESIIKRSLESFNLNLPGTAYFDPQLGSLAEYYQQHPNAKYWVAVNDNDEVLGGAGIGPFGANADVCELQKLYLTPAAQGQGIAKQLMQTALTFAAEHYKFCYLETFQSLEAANTLYLKFGFRQLETPFPDTEHGACDAWYVKDLAQ
ncbi:GNAT family N-acetyltransferase [Paenibacillus sp. WLX1005]|uniref:GNAT family N-acetyltransferase n=1 Tax=Paenibacillus sp. WLX1005 TaxID=3243766 RepID=UPI003983DBDF